MANVAKIDKQSFEIAEKWCKQKGPEWKITEHLGDGGTASVFEIASPDSIRALKVYEPSFSAGEKGKIELKRIDQQLALSGHDCCSLVQVYEGGVFEDRLYLLMSRAAGKELEKCLLNIPRDKIRYILDQVAKAVLFLKSKDLCHRDIKASNIFISEDFNQVTLLDISVIRNIFDPIGVGTDHEGQLPVVATARYSPPEYLFRLIDTGPDLWHALSIYQLGALLHDLIMKEPLFQLEYLKSAENRYRFAWIIATDTPMIQAEDVDQDLVFIARRALDKDWKRRSTLSVEDFLADSKIQQNNALQIIGFSPNVNGLNKENNFLVKSKLLRRITDNLEKIIIEHLKKNSITAEHFNKPGANDDSKSLTFRWKKHLPEMDTDTASNELKLTVTTENRFEGYYICVSVILSAIINEVVRSASMDLPDVLDNKEAEIILATNIESALPILAVELTKVRKVK